MRNLLLTGFLLACCITLPGRPDDRVSVIRSTTRTVRLNVVAEDKNGRPVTGLTRDDIIVLDEGIPQTVTYFKSPIQRQSEKALLSEETSTNGSPANPGSFSNLTGAGRSGRTVILLDVLNTSRPILAKVMDQIQEFLARKPVGEEVPVFVLGSKLLKLDDLSSEENRKAVLEASQQPVSKLQSDPDAISDMMDMIKALKPGVGQIVGQAAMSSLQNDDQYYQQRRTIMTVDLLNELSRQLELLPGPKALIWVTGGFPLTVFDYNWSGNTQKAPSSVSTSPRWHTMLDRFSQSNITVYPADNRMMQNGGRLAARSSDTMQLLAGTTGGKVFNRTRLCDMIQAAADEAGQAYELAFSPGHGEWNGQYRRITLQCKIAGITLRGRRGYVAADEPVPDADGIRQEMILAAASPLDATHLGFTLGINGVDRLPDRLTLSCSFGIRQEDLRFKLSGEAPHATLDVLLVPFDSLAKPLGLAGQVVTLYMPAGRTAQEMERTVHFKQEYPIPLETAMVRIVLRDQDSGKIGSLRIPLPAAQTAAAGQ